MKWTRKAILLGGLFALTLFIVLPTLTHAQAGDASKANTGFADLLNLGGLHPTYEVINNPANISFWKFWLSFVNYGIIIVLIMSAFATVLRINIDTYTIKKSLPGVFTGFILAHMSRFICQLILQFSESLYHTFQNLGGGASVGSVMLEKFQTAVFGIIGFFSAIFFTGGGPGVILGVIVGIAIISIPIIIQFLLLLLFIIRNYVVQFLVGVSPVAFLVMSIPFAQSYFKKWWQYFSLWTFMKPTAFAFIMVAAVILKTDIGGPLVGFAVGIAAMLAALYVPFKSGGWINAQALKLAKGAGSSARNSALIGASNWAEKGGVRGYLGGALAGALSLPETVQLARKKRADKAQEAGIRYAAGQIREKGLRQSLENKRMSEVKGDVKELSTEEVYKKLESAKDPIERAAYMSTLAERGHSGRAYKNMKNGPKGMDPEAVKRWEIEQLGGTINADGTIEGEFAARIGSQLDDLHKKGGVTQYGFRQEFDAKSGKNKILTNQEGAKRAAGMYETDPYTIPRSLTAKGVITEFETTNAKGEKVKGQKLYGAVPKAIADGVIDEDTILNPRGFDKSGMKAIHDNWETVLPELNKDFAAYMAEARNKFQESQKGRTAEQQVRAQTSFDEQVARSENNFNAFKARIQPGGNRQEVQRQFYPSRNKKAAQAPRVAKGAAIQSAPRSQYDIDFANENVPGISSRNISLT